MSKRLIVFAALLVSPTLCFADVFFRNKSQYKTSEAAKQYFGAADNYQPTQGIDFGNIQAEISTKMDCGRIDIVTDFEGQFNKIRKQAKEFVRNLDGYLAAVPTLYVCQFSPGACAILRHDQFIFSQNLNLRAQACAAIDRYISNQADIGEKQLQAEGKRNCVDKALLDGLDMASATEECQDPTSDRYQSGMPLRDLSDGLRKKFTNSKQRVLASILGQVNENQAYPYLASLLGEIEIQSDGYWQPLWPHRMYKPYEVAKNTLSRAEDVVCNNLQTTLNAQSTGSDDVKLTIREKLNIEDAANLEDLLDQDRKMACAALGRALGAIAVTRTAARNEAVLSTALTNSALTEGLRDEYRKRSRAAFDTLRLAVTSEQIPNVEEVRNAVRELASAQRKYNRASAANLSQSRLQNQSQKLNEDTDCVDTNSCN